MRVIRTSMGTIDGKEYSRLRLQVNMSRELLAHTGWREGDEVEAVPHKDGILLRKAR